MALTKYNYLDQAGLQEASTLLYKSINTRIRERILTTIGSGTASDDNHTLSAKVILGTIGTTADASTAGTVYGYVNGQVSAINTAIGDDQDVAADGTVYGYINGQDAAINNKIGTASDAAATNTTVYAYINSKKADTDTKIGQTTDATTATTVYGYINKKKKDVDDAIGTTADTTAGTVYGYINAQDTAINNKIGATTDATTASTVYGYINNKKADTDNKIGASTDATTANTVYGYINAREAAVRNDIGASTDATTANTVYGYINAQIAAVNQTISGLTHLTYQTVDGPISGVVDPQEDIIYLQHDLPSYSIGQDGYLLDENGDHASANDGTNDYEAWYDASDEKIYKMVAGVKGAELASNDPIFEDVALIPDNTYNLYVWVRTSASGVTPVTHKWVCVGDTEIALDNYWSKSDADVAALRARMIEALNSTQITNAVQAAFNATDPYAGSGSYIWDT